LLLHVTSVLLDEIKNVYAQVRRTGGIEHNPLAIPKYGGDARPLDLQRSALISTLCIPAAQSKTK
jgi:hypothetical protein